jgi:DNA mismatch repair protein MutS2
LNVNTFRVLEFDAIRMLLVSHAGSVPGRERLSGIQPLVDPDRVREALATTGEGLVLLDTVGRQPFHDLPDLAQVLTEARVAGAHLEPKALMDVASFIEGGAFVAREVAQVVGAPRLSRRAAEVKDCSEVAAAIRRAILPSGEVADDASPRLAEIRRSLARLRLRLQSVMESFLRGKEADRLLQDKLITTRNDRYVLLLKAEHRGDVPGIIHGSSGSGASVFVEPMPAVELNNDIVSMGDDEREEVVRILLDLTGRVAARAADLAHAATVLGELDAVQAMALVARDMGASPPEIVDGLDLELIDARHPLLMPALTERLGMARRSTREPVPVTLRVGFGAPVLVISGPNTGGKTVALKTVGLLALMAQCGLHVPAAPGSRLPVFRRVYADIGDEQSIAADLSTFSAHLATIVEMTRDLQPPSLVLLDEVGAGTDPTEGGALGVAIVDYFRAHGAMVMATTHHGLLKAYAQATPGVGCASFGYDPKTYAPTYRLNLGKPGRSLALEMAERLGLAPSVVKDARSRLDDKEAQAEALLKKLEDDQAALRVEAERIAADRAALREEQERLRDEDREIAARKRTELESFTKDLRRRGEEAARKAADAIHEAVKKVEGSPKTTAAAAGKARTAAVASIREAQEEALRDVAPPPEAAAPGIPLAVGARVRIQSLGVTGEVMALPTQGEAEIAVSGKRLKVPRSELVVVAGAGARPAPARGAAVGAGSGSALVRGKGEGAAAREINLVGLTVDEALPRVDKMLDDAFLAETREVRVVHGFGAGRLRQAVAGLLQDHPHVAAFRLGGAGEGGGGVTVVELKE